jgi:hypothetical protein
MNCRYVQSRLSAYLDFELSGDEQQLIRSHLEECIECSCEFESLRRTKQLLRQMPIVKPHTGPEQVLLRVRQAQPTAPRPAWGIRWHPPRAWQYAGGFALAAAIFFWGRANDTELSTVTTASPTPSYFTPTSNPLFPTVAPELSTVYRPYTPNLLRRASYPMSEPSLMPSVSYPMDPMLGYQPVSEWNNIPSQPKFIETPR